MSLISNNLKYLRRINGLTQDNFAKRIGTKRANVGAYEESRAVPPVELLKVIANTFGISVDDFVKKDIRKLRDTPDLTFSFSPKSVNFTSNERSNDFNAFTEDFDIPQTIGNLMGEFLPPKDFFDEQTNTRNFGVKPFEKREFETPKKEPVFEYQPPKQYSQTIENQTVRQSGNILLVKRFQYNDYLTKYNDSSFLKTLTDFSIPNLPFGEYMAFEAGEDFAFEGALLVGLAVKNLLDLTDGKNYILVTKSHGIIYRRVYNRINDKGTILLSADNHRFMSMEISLKDVLAAFEVKAFVSQTLPEPTKSYEKLNTLAEEMKFELERLKK